MSLHFPTYENLSDPIHARGAHWDWRCCAPGDVIGNISRPNGNPTPGGVTHGGGDAAPHPRGIGCDCGGGCGRACTPIHGSGDGADASHPPKPQAKPSRLLHRVSIRAAGVVGVAEAARVALAGTGGVWEPTSHGHSCCRNRCLGIDADRLRENGRGGALGAAQLDIEACSTPDDCELQKAGMGT